MWVTRTISALPLGVSWLVFLCTCSMDLSRVLLKSPFLPPQTPNMDEPGDYGNSWKGNASRIRRRHVWLTVAMQEIQTTLVLKWQAKLFYAECMRFVLYPALLDSMNKERKSRHHMRPNTALISSSQLLFKLWLTSRCSSDKDKICVPSFLTGNTTSLIKIDFPCPVAEAWWALRACPSFQPCSCNKEGTWCR